MCLPHVWIDSISTGEKGPSKEKKEEKKREDLSSNLVVGDSAIHYSEVTTV